MRKNQTVASLIEATEQHFRLAPGSLTALDRSEPMMSYRRLAMLVAREAGYEYAWIGRAFNRDRTTAENSCRAARQRMDRKQHWWLYAKADLVDAWHDYTAP